MEVGEKKEGDEVVEVWGPIVEMSGERVVASDGEGEGVGVTTKGVWVVVGDLVDEEWGRGSGNEDCSRLFEGEGVGGSGDREVRELGLETPLGHEGVEKGDSGGGSGDREVREPGGAVGLWEACSGEGDRVGEGGRHVWCAGEVGEVADGAAEVRGGAGASWSAWRGRR